MFGVRSLSGDTRDGDTLVTAVHMLHCELLTIAVQLFPISWQDAGTGVFAFACSTAILLATMHRHQPGDRTLKVAGISASAFVVDVYTW